MARSQPDAEPTLRIRRERVPGARMGDWRFETDVVVSQKTKVQWTGDSGMR